MADMLSHMPCLEDLEISYNCALEGAGLEVLPRCCPSLKALHLKHLPNLADCWFPALQQSEELVELIFEAVPLDSDEPCALAAHFPPNLTVLLLHYMPESCPRIDIPDEIQCEEGVNHGFGHFMTGILDSLPTLRAPLRYLCLQRGHRTPFEDPDIDCLVAAAPQLQYLEKLELGDVLVSSHGLRRLVALPALAELTVQTFCDDLDDDEDWLVDERSAELKAALASVRAAFSRNGRSLITELGRI
jgi:hypothetical protein